MANVSYNIQLCIYLMWGGAQLFLQDMCCDTFILESHNRFSNGMVYGQWCKDRIIGCSINML